MLYNNYIKQTKEFNMDRFEMPTYYEELCIQCNNGACCGDCEEDLFDEDLIIVKKSKSTDKSILSQFCKSQAKKYNLSECTIKEALNSGECIEDWISCTQSNPYYSEAIQ